MSGYMLYLVCFWPKTKCEAKLFSGVMCGNFLESRMVAGQPHADDSVDEKATKRVSQYGKLFYTFSIL